LNVAHIAGEPSYAVTASPVEEDVPPTALPGGGVTSQQPIAPPAGSPQASSLVHSSIPAAAPAPLPPVPIQLPRADGETKSANPNVAESPPEIRAGPGCLDSFSASISGASAGVRLPSGKAAA